MFRTPASPFQTSKVKKVFKSTTTSSSTPIKSAIEAKNPTAVTPSTNKEMSLKSTTKKNSTVSPSSSSSTSISLIDNDLGIELHKEDIIFEETKSDDVGGSTTAESSSSLDGRPRLTDRSESLRLPDGSIVSPLDVEHLESTEVDMERKTQKVQLPGSTSHCLRSLYGKPILSNEKALELFPKDDDSGVIYHARLIPDDRTIQEKLQRRGILIPKRDIDSDGNIRPRRGQPLVLMGDFMSSLLRIPNENRWVFSGVLNGWPGLAALEVRSITCRTTDKLSTMFDGDGTNLLRKTMLRTRLIRLWSADKQGRQGIPPHVHSNVIERAMEVRVTLRAPPYSMKGYSKDSPGLVFWFEAQRPMRDGGPRMIYGEDILRTIRTEEILTKTKIPTCTTVHKFSHRYATGDKKENAKDKVTYHSAILLEWDHGQHVTVVELGLLNGLGGYGGKCNWYDDKNEDLPSLYMAMPPEMVAPWHTSRSEIRCCDVKARTMEEFKTFIKKYSGPKHRFLDPRFTHSHPVRISFRSKEHIVQYLLNYIGRDAIYSELNRNCQTFAADLYGFLAGKRGIEPFHPINRVDYTNRSYQFLYDADMYNSSNVNEFGTVPASPS